MRGVDVLRWASYKKNVAGFAGLFCLCTVMAGAALVEEFKSGINWPEPKIVNPGPIGGPPSDATVLFDGKDLSQWEGGDQWEIKDGYAVARGTGITTKQPFGDCQLHVEWASPSEVSGSGQGRGNSGVYLMGKYELQVLDSFENVTYFDGQAGAIYKQRPPLVNASRPPGEWQAYDIVFQGPRFDEQGKLLRPGYMTVLHNGVLIQNHTRLLGGTFYERPPQYEPHPDKLPIHIQFHGNPVRYRNLWIRELPEEAAVPRMLRKGERIVFLGDSITQAGAGPNGYVTMIRTALTEKRPDFNIEVLGAGISGNKVPDLQRRLEADVLAKQPSLVVIYIGINDVWHGETDPARGTFPELFAGGLRDVIDRCRLAGARVVLCTPSVIGEKTDGMNPLDGKLDEYAGISRKVARQRNVELCDLRAAFLAHLKTANPENKDQGVLTSDRVHLNEQGNRFVAETLLKCLGE